MQQMPDSMQYNFLNGGPPDGCIRFVVNSTIIIYRIPREYAADMIRNEELRRPGVYFLLSTIDDTFYVGQSDIRADGSAVLGRMMENHQSDPRIDDWTEGYAFTSSIPHFLSATELNYLERKFYDIAKAGGRFVQNENLLNRPAPHFTEPDVLKQDSLDKYASAALYPLETVLGFSFKKLSGSPSDGEDRIEVSLCRSLSGIRANGVFIPETQHLIVRAGSDTSEINRLDHGRFKGYAELRQKLEMDGTIDTDAHTFTRDWDFSSPSAASCVVVGSSSDGRAEWKLSDGMTLAAYIANREM